MSQQRGYTTASPCPGRTPVTWDAVTFQDAPCSWTGLCRVTTRSTDRLSSRGDPARRRSAAALSAPAALARPRGSISRASRVPCPAPLTCGSSRGCDKGTAANVLYACLTLMGISSGEGGEGGFCYRDKGRRSRQPQMLQKVTREGNAAQPSACKPQERNTAAAPAAAGGNVSSVPYTCYRIRALYSGTRITARSAPRVARNDNSGAADPQCRDRNSAADLWAEETAVRP